MFRLFLYMLVVLGLGFLFAWVADRPGDLVLNWQGQRFETSLMVAVSAVVAIVASILIVWALVRGIIQSPGILSRFFANRRRDRGYTALSQGMIAASAGNVAKARKLAKESSRLLSDEPLVDLLDAQTSLLEGKRENARSQYAKMLDNENTRLLALRGLYIEAEREGSGEAARHYAKEASQMEPSLPWAGAAMLRFNAVDKDWNGALERLDANRAAGLIDKQVATKQKAVLLTAEAFDEEMVNPERAAKLAQQAHKLDSELVPAAVIGARAYTRTGDIKRASKLIEAVWRKNPHPELAEAYTHVRSGDSVLDRLKRAKHLASLRANHPESNMAVALAAIDANDWKQARQSMQLVITTSLTERACLIMADIEEGEHGDKGRMRDWLSRAVRAPRDAVWTADGYVSDEWLPMSPITGEVGAFEWKVPVEQLGGPGEVIDVSDLAEPLKETPVHDPVSVQPSKPVAATATAATVVAAETDAAPKSAVEKSGKEAVTPVDKRVDKTAPEEAVNKADADGEAVSQDHDKPEPDEKKETGMKTEDDDDVIEAEIIELKPAEKARPAAEKPDDDAEETIQTKADITDGVEDEEDDGDDVDFPLKHRPDDPGVDPAKVPEKKKFKLF